MNNITSKDKPVFETFNWYKSFKFFMARLVCLGIVTSAIVNFKQNPVVTTIAIMGFGYFFFTIGMQSVIVYHDRFEHRRGSLFDLFDKSKTYYYKDLKSISIDGIYSQAFDMIDNILSNSSILDTMNSIELEFKDGKTKSINTWIYKSDLRTAMKNILQEYWNYNNRVHAGLRPGDE